ncbi:MAG: hypothetical protein IIC73_07840 [Armatimonadetes bacterium]|nr:hypothetical protein [Armatimonadota bacterium]
MAHGGPVTDETMAGAALIIWNSAAYRDSRPGIVVHPPVRPEHYRTSP